MLTLYQAEWCPYSSAVRELLTELEKPFTAMPVEPQPEQRDALRELAGTDEIPVLLTEDGGLLRGTDEILPYLRGLPPGQHAEEHRQEYEQHREARASDETGRVLRG